MEIQFVKRFHRLAWILASTFVLYSTVAAAKIVGPYTPDSATLHLWHFDEVAAPVVDVAPGGTNFNVLANQATLGNASFPGFNTALSTYDGGPNGTNATSKDAVLSVLPLVSGGADNVALSYAHPVTGAFTYEALVRIDFDPSMNFGSIANGGNGRVNQMMIITAEDESNAGRLFQFRIDPIGTFTNNEPLLEFINVNQAVNVQNITVPIPMTGPDAIASNEWYHVAVSYNGNAGTPDNLKFFWTRMEESRTNANLIGTATMNSDLPSGVTPDFAIGNIGRGAQNGNFVGLIDEVRMSSVARSDTEMMFAGEPSLPPDIASATYLDCLLDFERHAEIIWHDVSGANRPPDSGYFGDGRSSGNGGIRGSCGVALAYAVLVHSLPDDPKNPVRLERIRKALSYAANTHVSGSYTCIDNQKWGHDWQSSLWAGSMGLACLVVQSNLPANTVEAVQRAIADEATYRAGIPPASGYIGDTKAEENAWNGNVVALAAAWLHTNASAGLWLDAAKKYLANTYTVSDTTGDPLADWVTTTTLYPSFAVENHGFYHPLYQMVSGMSMGDSFLMARLANPAVAAELQPFAEHNVLNVWNHLQHTTLDSSEFAYPSGLDWALHTFQQNSYYAWLATHFNDPLARWADTNLVQLLRYRQVVNGDGTFLNGTEANAFYMEAVIARRAAIAWLHHLYATHPNGPASPPPASVEHFSDIKLVTQRGPGGFVSISYGPKIMGLIEAPVPPGGIPTNVFVSSPRSPGVIGLGALGNPTGAQLVSFATNDGGFALELTLQHGLQGTTKVFVKSTGESVAIVEVPVPAAGWNAPMTGSFTMGIENHRLTGGSRLVEWNGGSTIMTNRSGIARNITNNWVCVSERYGVVAGPEGYFRYQTASGYNRLGAAEDTLQFLPKEPLGPRFAVWFPGKNSTQTAIRTSSISWTNSGENGILTFPGADGALQQITVPLPKPPPFPAYVVPVSEVIASSSQPGYPPANAVDNDPATFWVSAGTTAGQGPTPQNPQWLDFNFSRTVAVSRVQIAPRTSNGGYGPKDVQIFLNGNSIFTGTMLPTVSLDLPVSPPVNSTNARLFITSSYDPNFPNNSRNVQVVEASFWERALPGTFADWALRQFSEQELENPLVSSEQADPDFDGAVNFLEFAMGGQPLTADANFRLNGFALSNGELSFHFAERKGLVEVTREFQVSSNLVDWLSVNPLSLQTVFDAGDVHWLRATFAVLDSASFFRLNYRP